MPTIIVTAASCGEEYDRTTVEEGDTTDENGTTVEAFETLEDARAWAAEYVSEWFESCVVMACDELESSGITDAQRAAEALEWAPRLRAWASSWREGMGMLAIATPGDRINEFTAGNDWVRFASIIGFSHEGTSLCPACSTDTSVPLARDDFAHDMERIACANCDADLEATP